MSPSHLKRQRKKLSPFIASSSSARVLGDDSFFKDLLVKKQIESLFFAETVIGKFLAKEARLYTTE